MKAQELRIGNIAKIQTSSCGFKFIKINGFTESGLINPAIVHEKGIADCTIEDLAPIPLTPEILEKAGFEYYAWPSFLDFTHYIKNDFILRETGSGYSFFNTSSCDNSERQFLVQITFLHQLQNLYFALTGEELPIEL